MAHGKMTDEEKQTLISFYNQNSILWDNADPNYRNKVKRSPIKVKFFTLLMANFQKSFWKIVSLL